tara:strand:+ start:568 stop:750 length:183 start_codon:yes stop_codon:yes gene_type:complete
MKTQIKNYQLSIFRYIFNVYNTSNYKTPKKISITAPMLEIALETAKNKYPNYSVDFVEVV